MYCAQLLKNLVTTLLDYLIVTLNIKHSFLTYLQNINRLGFSSGSAASPLGILRNVEINAEDDDLLYNSKTRMKDFKKLLTFKVFIL